jgi:hypothetical protein
MAMPFPNSAPQPTLFGPVYALNKPGKLGDKAVVRIPERFRGIV